jgi:lipopolysaccharide transport system permease protein
VVAPLVDFGVAFIVLIGLMLWHGIAPTWATLVLPLLVLQTLVTALAIGVWLSAVNVRYRDVGHAIPFLIQFWMYASPVVYPLSVVPESWRALYSLNPMVGVIEGFRWALLGKGGPDLGVMVINVVVVATVLLAGLFYFARVEQTFADVV